MELSWNKQRKIKAHIQRFTRKPLISLIVLTHDTSDVWLQKMILSVQKQLYPNWELCIVHKNSSDKHLREILKRYAEEDKRIKVLSQEGNRKASSASNSALKVATGEFVAFMGQNDKLSPDAIYHVAVELEKRPDLDMLYTDNDKVNEREELSCPSFKTEWNPDLMMSHNMITSFALYRKSLVDQVAGLQEDYEDVYHWDLALRFSEITNRGNIIRIPRMLYHSRITSGSTGTKRADDKDIISAGKRSIEGHIKRRHQYNNLTSEVEYVKELPFSFRVKWRAIKEPKVSLIILTRDGLDDLKACIHSIIEKTSYSNYEIIIVDNGSINPETFDYLRKMERNEFIQVQRNDIPFNFSRLNNEAIPLAKGEIIGLVNNDVTVISPEWLDEMVGQVIRPHVGAVGARLLYPDGTLQHGGLVIGINGVAGHAYRGLPRESGGFCNRVKLIHNCSGVTAACLLVRKQVYEEVGGLDQENLAVSFNDVDFSLKLTKAGYDIVYTPYAELYHHESKSRGADEEPEKQARLVREMSYIRKYWGNKIRSDPYYNPNLTYSSELFCLAVRPRLTDPWQE